MQSLKRCFFPTFSFSLLTNVSVQSIETLSLTTNVTSSVLFASPCSKVHLGSPCTSNQDATSTLATMSQPLYTPCRSSQIFPSNKSRAPSAFLQCPPSMWPRGHHSTVQRTIVFSVTRSSKLSLGLTDISTRLHTMTTSLDVRSARPSLN